MSAPTIGPGDLPLPDWQSVPNPTQDRSTEEVEDDESPAGH